MYRNLITKYAGACADCGAELPPGSKARYYGRGRLYGIDCHDDTAKTPTAAPILAALLEAAAAAGSAYSNYAAEDHIGTWRLGEFSLRHSSYDGSWHLSGYGADSVTGGTGNGALRAADAGAGAFVASMAAAGYDGLRVESRID